MRHYFLCLIRLLFCVMPICFLWGCGGGGDQSSSTNSPVIVPVSIPLPVPAADAKPILLLYDAPVNQPQSKLGFGYAIMLRNLLGHFNTRVDFLPVDAYTSGYLENYDTTFYLGSFFGNALPDALLTDVRQTTKKVVWFKYNLDKLAAKSDTLTFTDQYGIQFMQNRDFLSPPSASNPHPDFFDTVSYKGKSFVKHYVFNPTTLSVEADPVIGLTKVIDASKASVKVNIENSQTKEVAPYIVQSNNFWYVADIPFSFIGPRDRYLVFCDMLFDILGETPAVSETRALVRLEDISFLTQPDSLKRLADELSLQKVPFSMAVIPFYRDPLGVFSGGAAQEVHFSQANVLRDALTYSLAKGGKVLMHGYTHQYNNVKNSVSAVSGADYEFWNEISNTPVTEDSVAWSLARLDAGLAEFKGQGFTPFAWETPHYKASPNASKAIPQRFAKTYQRVTYYTSDTPDLNANINRDFALNQFFPYVIHSDYYSQMIIPENLGNIELGVMTEADILENARYAGVVRDGFASFFYHPYLINPAGSNAVALAAFKKLIEDITLLGYRWTDPSTLN